MKKILFFALFPAVFASGAFAAENCPAGYYSNGEVMESCPSGYYKAGDVFDDAACPVGYFKVGELYGSYNGMTDSKGAYQYVCTGP